MGIIFRWSTFTFTSYICPSVVSENGSNLDNPVPFFSLLWVIVHAYVITQIVDDDDLKVQRWEN